MSRVLTALVLIPVVVFAILSGYFWVFFAVLAAVALLCFREYCGIFGLGKRLLLLGSVAGLLVLLAVTRVEWLLLLGAALAALSVSMAADDLSAAQCRAGSVTLGVLYIFGSWKTASLLWQMNPYWLIFGLVLNWVGDSGAYYVGRKFGRHKMAPQVSPGKSWEGAAASLISSVTLSAVILPRVIPGVPIALAAGLAVAGNVAGQLGDLAESALKRGAGVKDSGTLLPGHGGMLDRVDSALFTLPVLYTLLTVL